MAFKRVIWGEKHCPRCNGVAQLRSHPFNNKMVELRLDCNYCKLSKFVQLTTEKFLDLTKKEEKWLKFLERETAPSRRNIILKKLENIRKERLRAEVQP